MTFFFRVLILVFLFGSFSGQAFAGDCNSRTLVDWYATIKTATNIRVECDDHKGPVGESLGVASAGEVVRIIEVDRNEEYFVVEMENGRGFVYKSFLKDIVKTALPRPIFQDLNFDHPYYDAIAEVKEKGIVRGTPDGKIHADKPINRVELAKILVEATSDDSQISLAPQNEILYRDVQRGAWYLPYLSLAQQKGFMSGDSSIGLGLPTVRPGDFANGAEVAKMIAVAFDLDVVVDSEEAWYRPYLDLLQQKNALPYSQPNHRVTRGEMMFMIHQLLP
ncbi:MAG: S-layer homology domain-containing protein [Candidatus Gracilibacteria bacterium]|nr:S-layer homology domain-containing protein [Candidatus Gracilibacteria bacterium]